MEIYKEGFAEYKKCYWNWVDWVNLLFFYLTICWRINTVLGHKPSFTNIDEYESYRRYIWNWSVETYFNIVNGFLLMIKLFKYLSAFARMQLLFKLLQNAAGDISVFGIIMFVIYLAFGIAGFLIFSTDVSDFRSLSFSILNLLRFTVSDMDYEALNRSHITVGSIYYVTWTTLMFLVLVNVFVAILTDGYSAAQTWSKEQDENIPEWLIQIKGIYSNIFNDLDANNDAMISLDELTKVKGSEEAKRKISAYDEDGDGMLNKEEFMKMKRDSAYGKAITASL